LQGEGEPEFFLVPLSFARRGARRCPEPVEGGEVFESFHVISVLGMSCESLPRRGALSISFELLD